MILSKLLRAFDAAARHYDQVAKAQAIIAAQLVTWVTESGITPATALDVGSGTGLVAEELHRRWPEAQLTALDSSTAMLERAQRKLPQLSILVGDIRTIEPEQKFDAIFSSMVLHWLPDPRAAIMRWQSWLKPGGRLFASVPVEGSFHTWRDLCRAHDVEDGLWPLPPANFADDLAERTKRDVTTIAYPSARDFLRSIKATGAATSRPDHKPAGAAHMRRMLGAALKPFPISYRLTFLECSG